MVRLVSLSNHSSNIVVVVHKYEDEIVTRKLTEKTENSQISWKGKWQVKLAYKKDESTEMIRDSRVICISPRSTMERTAMKKIGHEKQMKANSVRRRAFIETTAETDYDFSWRTTTTTTTNKTYCIWSKWRRWIKVNVREDSFIQRVLPKIEAMNYTLLLEDKRDILWCNTMLYERDLQKVTLLTFPRKTWPSHVTACVYGSQRQFPIPVSSLVLSPSA